MSIKKRSSNQGSYTNVGQTVNGCGYSPSRVIAYAEHRKLLEGLNVFYSSSTRKCTTMYAGRLNDILRQLL